VYEQVGLIGRHVQPVVEEVTRQGQYLTGTITLQSVGEFVHVK